MSTKIKHYITIICVSVIIVFVLATQAMAAEENYRKLPTQENIALDKANWTIHFTLPIDETSLNQQNIYITKQEDQTRHPVKFETSLDKKTIYIISQKQYDKNSTYSLFIEAGLCSNTSPSLYLTKKSILTFTTIKDEEIQVISETRSDTSISSSTYVVLGESATITGVVANTDASTFKSHIVAASGASIEVYQSDMTSVRSGSVQTSDVLIVTAQDQKTKKTYNITVNSNDVNQLDAQTLADLQVVSQGLIKVINSLSSDEEKAVASAIKDNIDNKIADPTFDHTAQINNIKAMYGALNEQQRSNFQDAVMYNIPVQRLIRLAEYFGFK